MKGQTVKTRTPIEKPSVDELDNEIAHLKRENLDLIRRVEKLENAVFEK
jgi:hypothetical protein